MKTLDMISSKDLSFFNDFRKEWYVLQSSVYSGNSFMIRRMNPDGSSETVFMGSKKQTLKRLAELKAV